MMELSDYFGKEMVEKHESIGYSSLDGMKLVETTKKSPLGIIIMQNLDFYKIKLNSKSIKATVNILNKQDIALNIRFFKERNLFEQNQFNRKITKVTKTLKKTIKILNLMFDVYGKITFNAVPSFFLMSNIENIIVTIDKTFTSKQFRSLLKNGANKIQIQFSTSNENENVFAGLSEQSIAKNTKIQIVSLQFYRYRKDYNNYGELSKVKSSFFKKISYFKIDFNNSINLNELRVMSSLIRLISKNQSKLYYQENRHIRQVNTKKNLIKNELDVLRVIENLKQN